MRQSSGGGAARPEPTRETKLSDDHGLFSGDFRSFREAWADRGEREYVERVLRANDGVVSAAAQAAGVDRTYFYKLMRRLGVAPGTTR
jgi:transcriptional regulator of acetoin/glycerol metabolism